MSKIGKAIYQIEYMNEIASRDQWVNRRHPLVKLFLTIFYIFVVVSFNKYNLQEILSMCIYPIVLFNLADLSFRDALKRLRVVLPIVCVMGLFNPFFDREVVTYWGSLGVSGGVLSMLTLMIKGVLTVFASYILIATTTIEGICYGLRLIHVPKIVVTEIMLIYRYITLMLNEARKVTEAYSLRAPGQKGVHFKVWGSLVGQLLLRSMDRADNVYESMCIRGYKGEFNFYNAKKNPLVDLIYLVCWIGVILVCRIFPVFEIIGGLFV